jgi:hypothetical protein
MTTSHLPYRDLAELADLLFARSGDDEERFAGQLDTVDPATRQELISSDLLNAYQVFFYFFREEPGDLEKELMMLQPASALVEGIRLRETDFLEMHFRVEGDTPVMTVSESGKVLVNYRGRDAYRRGIEFIDNSL